MYFSESGKYSTRRLRRRCRYILSKIRPNRKHRARHMSKRGVYEGLHDHVRERRIAAACDQLLLPPGSSVQH